MGRTLAPFRLLVIAALAGAVHLPAQRITVGRPLGTINLPSLSGDSVRLDAYRGHPLIVKFWATWCPTCRTEMPEIAAARASNRGAGLGVVTINAEDPPERIRRYLATLSGVDSLTVLLDPHSHVGTRLGIPVLPTTVFVDGDGVVRAAYFGAITPAQFVAGVRSIVPAAKPE